MQLFASDDPTRLCLARRSIACVAPIASPGRHPTFIPTRCSIPLPRDYASSGTSPRRGDAFGATERLGTGERRLRTRLRVRARARWAAEAGYSAHRQFFVDVGTVRAYSPFALEHGNASVPVSKHGLAHIAAVSPSPSMISAVRSA